MASSMATQGSISIRAFLLGCTGFLLYILFSLHQRLQDLWNDWWITIYSFWVVLMFINVRILFSATDAFQNAIRGCLLGCACSLGLIISFTYPSLAHFGWYFTALSIFHWSEYYTTAVTNPKSLTLDSYLLDHSAEYKIAAAASWIEYSIEFYFYPGIKQWHYLSVFGLLLVVLGEVIRKLSMFTASTNFNHFVQYRKQADHQLITHGVYSLSRHPSYVGWFLWSIGTQVILCNPVCLVGYTIVSWRFFRQRIFEEEMYLLDFFGEEYIEYQKNVGTGLPFIKGYQWELYD